MDYRDGEDKERKEEEDERLKALVGLLEAGGASCKVTEDIQSERWIKVIW